jgi:TetR/AcrR family transcriptional regulator, repressor for uid operon
MRLADPELQHRRRDQIIAAAEACFLKNGFHQTSMQHIATASGLSMGLLYRYFPGKEAIIDAVAQQDRDASLAAIDAVPVAGDVVPAWISLIGTLSDVASGIEYATLVAEIHAESYRSPKILTILLQHDEALVQAIAQKLTLQQKAGAVKLASPVSAVAQTMLILLEGLTLRKSLAAQVRGKTEHDDLQRIVSFLLS